MSEDRKPCLCAKCQESARLRRPTANGVTPRQPYPGGGTMPGADTYDPTKVRSTTPTGHEGNSSSAVKKPCTHCGKEVAGGTFIQNVFYCPMCTSIINKNNQPVTSERREPAATPPINPLEGPLSFLRAIFEGAERPDECNCSETEDVPCFCLVPLTGEGGPIPVIIHFMSTEE